MGRVWATAAVAALACMATGRAAEAQRGWLRRDSRLDLAAYAGGSYSTRWFTLRTPAGVDQGFRPGYGPVFGATATWWGTPSLGLQAHASYIPTDLPDADANLVRNGSFGANHYLYDLALSYRPWVRSAGARDWLASTRFFAGGGGLTTSIAGSGGCAPEYPAASGVCLPRSARAATVGQAVVGAGMDLYPMSRSAALFGEAALHAYRSPAHVSSAAGAREGLAFTPRVAGGVRWAIGGTHHAQPPVVRLPPLQPPRPVPHDTATGPQLSPASMVRVCVVQGGELAEVEGRVSAAGDTTTVDGRPFAEAYPDTTGYAAGERWLADGETVVVEGRRYEKVGLPRIVPAAQLRQAGTFRSVPLFTAAGETGQEMLYVPLRRGCEFQPYQRQEQVQKVRG